MAYFDQGFMPHGATFKSRVARLFETQFDRRNRQLSEQVTALRALSDAELAARGLRRDEILFHVFAGKQR